MKFTQEQLIQLFGEQFRNMFESSPRQEYLTRCSEVKKIVRDFQGSLSIIYRPKTHIARFKRLKEDSGFEQIFMHLLVYTNLSKTAALKTGFEQIRDALVDLMADLDELDKKFAFISVDFAEIDPEYKARLEEYVRISEHLRGTDEVKDLEEKMRELALESAKKLYGPFVLVCASRGTGKTNMAFSFNSPFLYFLNDFQTEQIVYKCFRHQSEKLSEYIHDDYEKYARELIANAASRSKHKGGVGADDIGKFKLSYKSVGFLVEFIRRVKALHGAFPRTNPAELQVSIRNITFRPMTIEEGRVALRTLFGTDGYYFPITFDECSIEMTRRSEKQNAKEFTFLRSVVRNLLCIPIFMGTNAHAANFLGISKRMRAGSRNLNRACWCLVYHRPPGVSIELMTAAFVKLKRLVELWKEPNHSDFPSDAFLDFLKKYLQKERPLFLLYTERFIESFCCTPGNSCASDEDFLARLTESIMEQFMSEKDVISHVNSGSLAYMTAFTWDRELSGGATRTLVESETKSDLYIHSHLGYLRPRPNDARKYMKIGTKVKRRRYKRVYLGTNEIFRIFTRFEMFNDAPLTGLIVTGVTGENRRVFCEEESLERISMMSAIMNDPELDKSTTSAVGFLPRTSGFRLELALYVSSILASRGGGFKGCPFSVFLEYLAREFDVAGVYHEEPPTIVYDQRFPKAIREKMIPFLSSMAVNEWDSDLAASLESIFIAFLGTAIASTSNDTADLVITGHSNRDAVILAGECKLFPRSVDASVLSGNIMGKFNKFPGCNLFLAVAPKFSALEGFHNQSVLVWVLERINGKLHLNLLQTKVPQNLNATRHIIVIGMNHLSKYEDDQATAIIKPTQTSIPACRKQKLQSIIKT